MRLVKCIGSTFWDHIHDLLTLFESLIFLNWYFVFMILNYLNEDFIE